MGTAATTTTRITQDVDAVLRSINACLSPAQEGQPNTAAMLRGIRHEIEGVRERIAFVEGGSLPEGYSLAAAIEAVSDLFADRARDGVTLQSEAVVGMIGLLNEAAAWAWCYERYFRALTGLPLPEDLAVLRLARVLSGRGVTVGIPEHPSSGQPTGGGAA